MTSNKFRAEVETITTLCDDWSAGRMDQRVWQFRAGEICTQDQIDQLAKLSRYQTRDELRPKVAAILGA